MKILVVGGGGREHVLAWKLASDTTRPRVFCAPGNAGTASVATNLPIGVEDLDGLLAWARDNKPDLTVVGPEAPLCAGLTDLLEAEGLKVFGPSKAAAAMEGSKTFAKEIMLAAGVPTAHAAACSEVESALRELECCSYPVVIKADGLAAGKGVIICADRAEAEQAVKEILVDCVFGASGSELLVEEFLEGEEASILGLVDGERVVLLDSSQDHKRALDGDQGLNTGGMGAYSPAPVVKPGDLDAIRDEVFLPVVRELKNRGITFKGVLYAGLMCSATGVKVLEFNVRFGDPEAQVVLPRWDGDILPALFACAEGRLDESLVRWKPGAAVGVVMASGGYPGDYEKGRTITGLEEADALEDVTVFHAGTALQDGRVVTSGGRVLCVTALGGTLEEAVEKAYRGVGHITFQGAHFRKDIAAKAFNRT